MTKIITLLIYFKVGLIKFDYEKITFNTIHLFNSSFAGK